MTTEEITLAAANCPKRMMFGPCADVGITGSCEVPASAGGPTLCVFLDHAPVFVADRSRTESTPGSPARRRSRQSPFIMSELPEDANSSADIRRVARRLAGSVDAVLFGDSNWMRVRFPPSFRARLVQDEGLGAWPGINARDRNRVAIESELLALADLDVAGVHCVTGNHPFSGNRPDAMPVFDLDSTRLTALANASGLQVSVAASPHTPPVDLRPGRTADKARAGASICMIDQPSSIEEVGRFIERTRVLGATELEFIAVVSVVFDRGDFHRWEQYPNARVPLEWAEQFEGTTDVETRGRELALSFSRDLLDVPGMAGILFASTAAPSQSDRVAETFATLANDLRSVRT